jgi:hypothetical protein
LLTIAHRRDATQSATFQLRPYQHEAINAIEQAEQHMLRRLLVTLPTGIGKTVIFAHLINPRAHWRQAPASDGQLRLLRYLGLLVAQGLTKGQAADLISTAKASRALRKGVTHG